MYCQVEARLIEVAALDDADDAPVSHDRDPVADDHQVVQPRRCHDDSGFRRHLLADDPEDRVAGAHVDAPRRLVQQIHRGSCLVDATDNDLLLVAPAQIRDLLIDVTDLDVEQPHHRVGPRLLRPAAHDAEPADPLERTQEAVDGDAGRAHKPFMLPVLGQIRDARSKGLVGMAEQTGLAARDGDGTARGRVDSGDALEQLRAATATQAGDPQHLAAMHTEGDVGISAGASEAGHIEREFAARHFPGFDLGARILLADDQRGQARLIELRAGHRLPRLAAQQDGHPVTDLQKLVDPMRDVQDRAPGRAALRDYLVQEDLVGLRQRSRRLIEDDDLGGVHVAGLHHQQQLLLAHAQIAGLDVSIQRQTDASEHPLRTAMKPSPVDDPPLRHLVPQEEVLRHGEVVDDLRLLRDDADALALRHRPRQPRDLATVDEDGAGGRLVETGDDADQSRLPGTVLADDAVHLSSPHLDVDSAERDGAGEELGDVSELERGRFLRLIRAAARVIEHGGRHHRQLPMRNSAER